MSVAQFLTLELYHDGICILIPSRKPVRTLIHFKPSWPQRGIYKPSASSNEPPTSTVPATSSTSSAPSSSAPSTSSSSSSSSNGIKITKYYKPATTPEICLQVICLVGYCALGPGTLIFVTESTSAINNSELSLSIHEVKDVLVVPLEYNTARRVFSKHSKLSKNEPHHPNKNDDEDEEPDTDDEHHQSDINLDEIEPKLVQEMPAPNKFSDIFVTNVGVLADSVKAQPQLSLNSENIIIRPRSESSACSHQSWNPHLAEPNKTLDGRTRSVLSLRSTSTRQDDSFFSAFSAYSSSQYHKGYQTSPSSLKKFRKNVRHLFRNGGFFFSFETDLTENIRVENGCAMPQIPKSYHELGQKSSSYFWNKHLLQPLLTCLDYEDYPSPLLVVPLILGYVGSIDLELQRKATGGQFETENTLERFKRYSAGSIPTKQNPSQLILISKRSVKRCGLRYMRRGIDDDGNVANFVETDQILVYNNLLLDHEQTYSKFKIIRGSIPLFFTQDSSKLQPEPVIQRTKDQNREKFKIHFDRLTKSFSDVTCVSLIEKKKREQCLGTMFQSLAEEFGIKFVWFDFHSMCSKMKFENVNLLLDEKIENTNTDSLLLQDQLLKYSYDSLNTSQKGVFRVNCIDCLDRTNVISKFLCLQVLMKQLEDSNYILKNESQFKSDYSTMWANNGDYISTQYASTNALKGDFTRTEKRKFSGVLNDGILTLSRYYYGYFTDFYRQVMLDFLLGNSDEEVFEQFESSLTNLDPNLIQQKEIERRIVLDNMIELLFETRKGEKVIGSWWVESNFEPNCVKGLAFKDIIFILSNSAIYFAEFQGNKLMVRSYRIKREDVTVLNYGHYYVDTATKMARNPDRNVGLRFCYQQAEFQSITLQLEDQNESECLPPMSGLFKRQSEETSVITSTEEDQCMAFKFPADFSYEKIKYTIRLISKVCYASSLLKKDIVSFEEAKQDTPFWKIIEYELRKLLWA